MPEREPSQNRTPDTLILAVIPLLSLVLFALVRGWSGPAYVAGSQDPSYAYLFNGLALASGHAPPMCVHPGSIVIDFVAACLRVMHPLATPDELAAAVVAEPERAIAVVNWLLALVFAGVLAWGGSKVARASGSLVAGCLYQLAPLLARQGLNSMVGARPEPILLICGAALAALLVAAALEAKVSERSLGIVAGLGLAAKIHFLPLLLPIALVLTTWRARWRTAGWMALAFFVVSLPSLPALWDFAGYVFDTLTRTGLYGSGETGLITPSAWLANFATLLKSDKALVALMGITAMFLLPMSADRRLFRVSLGVLAAQLFTFLVMAKQPLPHYLAAAASITGVQVGAIAILLHRRRAKVAALAFGLLLAGVTSYRSLNLWRDRQVFREIAAERAQLAETLQREFGSAVVAHYFQSSDLAFALDYGNGISGRFFTAQIAAQRAAPVIYDVWQQRLRQGEQGLDLPDISKPLVLTGAVMSSEDRARVEQQLGIKLTDVFHGKVSTIYLATRR